ncbi:hypothetical protein [Fluviicola sp.]|uniref:hypothetical protein n=1 Tax=Fluviicola sp. TaxID=1917219 RepID=UPI0031DA27FC
MKTIIYLLFTLTPFGVFSQSDSILQLRMEQGLNLMVIEPGEDPNGAQERPCGTFVTYITLCFYRYQVICGGEVKWQSEVFADNWCIWSTSQNPGGGIFFGTNLVLATPENPVTTSITFDMSLIIDKESLTEEEYKELLKNYNNFYFELENDILVDNGGSYILYKAGNYKMNQGQMLVKYYYTSY